MEEAVNVEIERIIYERLKSGRTSNTGAALWMRYVPNEKAVGQDQIVVIDVSSRTRDANLAGANDWGEADLTVICMARDFGDMIELANAARDDLMDYDDDMAGVRWCRFESFDDGTEVDPTRGTVRFYRREVNFAIYTEELMPL